MTELRTAKDFYRVLCEVEIPERAAQIISDDPSREASAELMAFANYAMETLESEDWTAQPQQVFFRRKLGRTLREVALPVYSLMEDEGALHLFAFHYDPAPSNPELLESKIIEREKSRLSSLVDLLRDNKFEPATLGDDPAVPHLLAVQGYLQSGKCKAVKYFVVTNHVRSERTRPQRTADGKILTEVIDLERLFRWAKGVANRSEIEVIVKEALGHEPLIALKAPSTTEDVSTYLTVLPGRFLAELYENFDNRLLELNVRSFLSSKGGVNKGILDTLRDANRRGFFLPYNNGIVMVVEDLHAEEVAKGVVEIKFLKGLQIVNGGQTTASLFKARRDMKTDDPLAGVFVQAKIVRLNRLDRADEIVKSISQYANSQNKVEMADLKANDAFHRRLEKLADKEVDPRNGTHWFYERMRNSYATQLMLETSTSARRKWQEKHPKGQVITKTDLAKYMLAWDQQPSEVARGSQKCFNTFVQSHHVRPIDTDAAAELELTSDRYKEIIGKTILYRATHQIVRADKELFRSNQINVATYTVAYLSSRVGGSLDWKAIWRNQGLSQEMLSVLKAYARRVFEYIESKSEGRLSSEVSKKDGLFEDLCRELVDSGPPSDGNGVPLDPVEMRGHMAPSEVTDPRDELTIREVMSISPGRLLAVRDASRVNPNGLSAYELDSIAKMNELAQRGWESRPSLDLVKLFQSAMAKLENSGIVESGA